MTDGDLMRKRFPVVSIEAALRFGTNEVRVGNPAPDFELPDLQGRRVRLSQFRGKSHVVLMFGNLTCGATITQLRAGKPTIRTLYTRYRKRGFEFFLINSRETHPGELVPQPTSIEQRRSNALRLQKEEEVNFPILVDSIDHRVRNLYHGWSNGIFVVNKEGDYLLVCERRASPSDRGQWFSALPATPHPLHGWKCPAAGPENKLCTPVPALSRSHPSIASWLLNCGLLNKSAWTYGPEVAQLLHDLSAWEKAEGLNELVRFCYSERIVGLLRDRRISASVHRRAGPQAARDFARLLEEEGKVG